MIEIKVTSREKARENCKCGVDAVLYESVAEVQVGGRREELKHEFISLVEAIEKKPELAAIWEEAICEHIVEMKRCD